MMRYNFIILFMIILFFFNNLSFGVEPDEILSDPSLEKRAREISTQLRCLVCRNENIDSSDAWLAKDLRLLVRERLTLGETNEEVLNYVHARYGDFVLLRPKFLGNALVLWLIAPFFFLAGIFFIYFSLYRNKINETDEPFIQPLSETEKRKIKNILKN